MTDTKDTLSPADAIVEAVARDLCIQDGCDPDGLISYVKAPRTQAHAVATEEWARYLDRARKSLRSVCAALERADWVVIPRLLTAAQADAATGKDNLVDIHRAMIAAAPKAPGTGGAE